MPQKIQIPAGATEVIIPDVIPTFTIPTNPDPTPNLPPLVSISGSISVTVTQGQSGTTTLTANASDPEGKATTIQWAIVSGSGTIASPAARTTAISGLTADTGVKVTVSDPEGLQASASVIIKVTTIPVTGRPNLTLESTFEGVAISGTSNIAVQKGQAWSNQQHDPSKSYGVSRANIARVGNNSCRFELRPGDGITSGSYRSEITGPSYGAKEELFIGFSVYPEKNSGNISVLQFHQAESGGIPPFAFWVSYDKKWGLVHTSTGNGQAGQAGNIYDWLGPVDYGKWTDWVIRIKFSNSTDGIIEIWKNGVQQTIPSAKGLTFKGITGYSQGPYLKAGVYAFDGIGSGSIVYLDEIRVGKDYESVKVG